MDQRHRKTLYEEVDDIRDSFRLFCRELMQAGWPTFAMGIVVGLLLAMALVCIGGV